MWGALVNHSLRDNLESKPCSHMVPLDDANSWEYHMLKIKVNSLL